MPPVDPRHAQDITRHHNTTPEDTVNDHTPPTDQQLDDIEARATSEHLTPGPWTLDKEGCDCGGDYPCGHGLYVTAVITPTPTWSAAERCKRTGEQPRDYDFHRSDIGDFTMADWELMAHAREDVPALVQEVRRLRAVIDPEDDLITGSSWELPQAPPCRTCAAPAVGESTGGAPQDEEA